jgi:hypothetical protein
VLQLSQSTSVIRFFVKLFGFLSRLVGLHRMLGTESFANDHTGKIMDPFHSLDDEWKSTYCDCSIKVMEKDLTLF